MYFVRFPLSLVIKYRNARTSLPFRDNKFSTALVLPCTQRDNVDWVVGLYHVHAFAESSVDNTIGFYVLA